VHDYFFILVLGETAVCRFQSTCLTPAKMRRNSASEGLLRKQKLNVHTCAVLAVLGFGSVTYGYTASIIGTTLGR
jgi:hypothetical protein